MLGWTSSHLPRDTLAEGLHSQGSQTHFCTGKTYPTTHCILAAMLLVCLLQFVEY